VAEPLLEVAGALQLQLEVVGALLEVAEPLQHQLEVAEPLLLPLEVAEALLSCLPRFSYFPAIRKELNKPKSFARANNLSDFTYIMVT
jgi:hypothetical protein